MSIKETEMKLIYQMSINPVAYKYGRTHLTIKNLSNPTPKKFWKAFDQLDRENYKPEEINIITIGKYVSENELKFLIGWDDDFLFHPVAYRLHVNKIIEHNAMLQTLDAMDRVRPQIEKNPGEGIKNFIKILQRTKLDTNDQSVESLADYLTTHLNLKEQYVLNKELPYLKVGYDDLDAYGMFAKGKVNIIAGYAHTGKTTFAMNILLHLLFKGIFVHLASLEMNKEEILDSLTCIANGVQYQDVRSVFDFDKHLMATYLAKVAAVVEKSNLWINDDTMMKPVNVELDIEEIKNKEGKYPEVVILDYIQLMDPNVKKESRYQDVGQVSKELLDIAKRTNICFIVLAQLSRAADEKEPELSHLRESGNLEADAYSALLLYKNFKKKVTTGLIKKNRNGGKIGNVIFDVKNGTGKFKEKPYSEIEEEF